MPPAGYLLQQHKNFVQLQQQQAFLNLKRRQLLHFVAQYCCKVQQYAAKSPPDSSRP